MSLLLRGTWSAPKARGAQARGLSPGARAGILIGLGFVLARLTATRNDTAVPVPDASAGQTADPAPNDTDLTVSVWQRPQRLGAHEALKGLGGVVAPFLAGFSLATVAVLVTATTHPKLWRPAVLALTAAAAVLIYSMQVAFLALEHRASPDEWLSWYPEAAVNRKSLADVRRRQALEYQRMRTFEQRYSFWYEVGLGLFLLGLGLLVWPIFPTSGWPYWRFIAVVVVGTALFVEVWWSIARLVNAHWEKNGSKNRNDELKHMWAPTPWPSVEKINKRLASLAANQAQPDAAQPDAANIHLKDGQKSGVAGVLDPERRRAAALSSGYPDLSGDPKR